MARKPQEDAVLVVGLGRFGSALAAALERVGHEVLAVEQDAALVQEWSGQLTHVVQADATSEVAMRQIGADQFQRAIVAVGTDIEASLLSAAVLVDLGVTELWGKAVTAAHGKILERVGVHHVVYPERDAGQRIAHVITGQLIDFIEFDDDYALAKIRAPRAIWDRTLAEAALRRQHGVTVVGVKRPGEEFCAAQPDTVVHRGDLLVVAGDTERVERLAAGT